MTHPAAAFANRRGFSFLLLTPLGAADLLLALGAEERLERLDRSGGEPERGELVDELDEHVETRRRGGRRDERCLEPDAPLRRGSSQDARR